MNNAISFIKRNFIYLLAGATIILALSIFVIGQLLPPKINPTPPPIQVFSPSPTHTPIPTASKPEAGKNYQSFSDADKEKLTRDSLINQLIKKLPFQGTNFSLTYDYSTNQFTATLKAQSTDISNQELDSFLKANQIEDRSWIKNLNIKYE